MFASFFSPSSHVQTTPLRWFQCCCQHQKTEYCGIPLRHHWWHCDGPVPSNTKHQMYNAPRDFLTCTPYDGNSCLPLGLDFRRTTASLHHQPCCNFQTGVSNSRCICTLSSVKHLVGLPWVVLDLAAVSVQILRPFLTILSQGSFGASFIHGFSFLLFPIWQLESFTSHETKFARCRDRLWTLKVFTPFLQLVISAHEADFQLLALVCQMPSPLTLPVRGNRSWYRIFDIIRGPFSVESYQLPSGNVRSCVSALVFQLCFRYSVVGHSSFISCVFLFCVVVEIWLILGVAGFCLQFALEAFSWGLVLLGIISASK